MAASVTGVAAWGGLRFSVLLAGRTALRPKTAFAPPPPCKRARASTRPHFGGIRHPGSSVLFGHPCPRSALPWSLRHRRRRRRRTHHGPRRASCPPLRAPHGPALRRLRAPPLRPSRVRFGLDGSSLLSSFILPTSAFPLPLPWPPLRGAIRAPGRSKRRPSMSAVPAAFCASFFLNPTRVTASRAFSHLAATAASSMAASLHRGKDSRPLFRPSI